MANWADSFSKQFGETLGNMQALEIKNKELAAQEELKRWVKEQDLPLRNAQEKYYKAITGYLNNEPSQQDQLGSGEQQFSPEDYMVTQETKNVRGIPKTVNVRKLKPALSEKHADVMTTNSNLLSQFQLAKEYLKQGAEVGWGNDIPFSDFMRKKFGKEASIKMAQVMKQMQSGYITSQTGAQRGFKEMQWYEPAMPTMNMPKEKLLPMIENSEMLQELNLRNMLISARKRGDRLGEYKETYDGLIEKYPIEIIPYGVGQAKAEFIGKNIEKVKAALAEGYSLNDILKHSEKGKNAKSK